MSRKSDGSSPSPKNPLYFKKYDYGELVTTDAFSTSKRVLNFTACNRKTAKVTKQNLNKNWYAIQIDIKIDYGFIKYIRIANLTNEKDMIEYMYNSNEDGWNLQKPNLILSVTGFCLNKLLILQYNFVW